MNWKIFFIKFFRNVIFGVVFSVVALGLFGFILGGKEGLINMIYWGIALGLMGGFSAGIGVIFQADFYGKDENYQLLPEWNWFAKQSDDDNQ